MEEHREHTNVPAPVADTSSRPSAGVAAPAGFHAGRRHMVRGLCCAEEVAALKQAVGPLVGGAERLAFDVLNGRMTIAEDGGEVAEETIITAVAATGMSAVRWTRP